MPFSIRGRLIFWWCCCVGWWWLRCVTGALMKSSSSSYWDRPSRFSWKWMRQGNGENCERPWGNHLRSWMPQSACFYLLRPLRLPWYLGDVRYSLDRPAWGVRPLLKLRRSFSAIGITDAQKHAYYPAWNLEEEGEVRCSYGVSKATIRVQRVRRVLRSR